MNALQRYARWLHTGFPAGSVEKLPLLGPDGRSSVPGLWVVGDLTGVPLLKFALDSGARAIDAVAQEPGFGSRTGRDDALDVAIIGGGVAGLSAAVEASRRGIRYQVLEASTPLSTLHTFPKGKPIFTYPEEMQPAGTLRVTAKRKETLIEELQAQVREAGVSPVQARVDTIERDGDSFVLRHGGAETRAHRVILAIGRAGEYRRLGVEGEDLPQVSHHLYDPGAHVGQDVLVVGGGDSAVEAAVALRSAGARVTLCHRGAELTRPGPANLARLTEARTDDGGPGALSLSLRTTVERVKAHEAQLSRDGRSEAIAADAVYVLIGREAPLPFLRRVGLAIRGDLTPWSALCFAGFVALCLGVYLWKSGGALTGYFRDHGLFPFGLPARLGLPSRGALWETLQVTLEEPGFHFSLAYTLAILFFGVARIRRRRTPYVTRQTLVLMAFQVVPLFLLPYLVLPMLGHAGAFDGGLPGQIADALMPKVDYGHGREYWRAFGLILAWPLFIWNFFTDQPMWGWLVIGTLQTFVVIPALVYRYGKGAYCGFICSCGALAETVGDRYRERMPHGPVYNRLNMLGQGILAVVTLMLLLRALTWWAPDARVGGIGLLGLYRALLWSDGSVLGMRLDYAHVVDMFLAGVVGVGCYFWLSGRVWCRFACPLAALMHIYARAFSRFAIFSDKARCISCNRCTASCHQGIDVMAFAVSGKPMDDPQCVRCSACVQACPTDVLSFGRRDGEGGVVPDRLRARPLRSGTTQETRRRLPIL